MMQVTSYGAVRTVTGSMHLVEAGSGFPVVMCHGFPEFWYSWRHQMRALADAGFRAIAPDQRGYRGRAEEFSKHRYLRIRAQSLERRGQKMFTFLRSALCALPSILMNAAIC